MKLCRDFACDYCYGGLIYNHMLDDDGREYGTLRREIEARKALRRRWHDDDPELLWL